MPGIAQALIEGGADPGMPRDGLTPLMRATIAKNVGLVKLLLAKGADPAAKDPQGRGAGNFVGAADTEMRKLLVR